jgi:predicted Zn-dependent protease
MVPLSTALAQLPGTDPAPAPRGLPSLGDAGAMTALEERKLGDAIIRELYRDPDYIDDPVVGEYVDGIWRRLLAGARARAGQARDGRRHRRRQRRQHRVA